MAAGLVAAALRIVGLGLVLAAMSEVWFYPVTVDAQVIWLCAFYGLLAYMAWLAMAQTRVQSWAGAFWGACLFGFLIEGIPVPVLYSAVPFTILWTSIAWHAVVSGGIGLWAFRVLCARNGLVVQLVGCAVVGLYLGLWSVELWSLREAGAAWVWTSTGDVAYQFAAGWAMFVAGHIALDLAVRFSAVPLAFECPALAVVTTALFVVGFGIAMFPLSLVLPGLAALSVLAMMRDGRGGQGVASPFLVRLSNLRVPVSGYAASLLIPITATMTYDVLASADLRVEASAIHILWAGPASLVLMVLSARKILTRA